MDELIVIGFLNTIVSDLAGFCNEILDELSKYKNIEEERDILKSIIRIK